MQVNLEYLLKKRKMTKYALAKKLDKDISNVFRMFRDDFNPRLDTLIQLAKVLQCGLDDIVKTKHEKKKIT